MKQEHINPFISASIDVLSQVTNIRFKTGAPYLKTSPFSADKILINLGITGSLRGNVVISMGEHTARDIASRMMMGMPVESLDAMAKSALCELGNMIMGNVATLLFNSGTKIDITPPTLFSADNVQISSSGMVVICVPMDSGDHKLVLDIGIKEAPNDL